MTQKMLDGFDFSQLDAIAEQTIGESFSDLLACLLTGNFSQLRFAFRRLISALLLPGLGQSRQLILRLLLLGLFAMLLKYFSSLVKNRQVTDSAYYFVYLMLMLVLIRQFEGMLQTSQQATLQLREFTTALIPAYCLSISVSNGMASAAANYQLMLWLLTGVSYIMQKLLLPLTRSYFFLVLMNGLDERRRLQGFMRLASKAINIGIRLCFMVVISVSTLENLMVSQIDGLQKTVVQKMIAAIPGIGDLSESVTQLFFRSAGMIRSGIGIAAILVLCIALLNPLLKLLCISFSIKLASALLGFMGLDRMSAVTLSASDGCMQLLKITLCAALMLCIVIAAGLLILGRGV